MKKYLGWSVLGWVLVGVAPVAWAQTIYRCGNEYTNNARQAKERGCKLVEGGHITVIHGQSGGGSAAPVSSSAGPRPAALPKSADSPEQRARDGDAKAILQAELDKANTRLATLKAEYKEGNPERSALELRNPQGYLQRVDELKANISRQESDIAGIQRELSRLP